MKFQVILPKSVQKDLNRLPDEIINRILTRLVALETNPRPADVKKLKGREAWRFALAITG
jgi:mRNA interferase RelE/StbE